MRLILTLILLAFLAPATHAAPAFPNRGRAGVVDAAHVLPPAAAHALNERVVAWDRRTGHQFVVATVPDLQGLDVKSYGYQLGRAWGLGDKARNDGAILLLAMKERQVRIEVGYGLEPTLTDAATSVILHDVVVPRLKAGDVPGALSAGADAIMAAVPADATPDRKPITDHHGALTALLSVLGGLAVSAGAWWAALHVRARRRQTARVAEARTRIEAARQEITRGVRPSVDRFELGRYAGARTAAAPTGPTRRYAAAPPLPTAPSPPASVYVAPVYEPRRDASSSSSSSTSSPDWASSSFGSSDSGSSSGGFDSGGGSFGGGGSDSSW